MINAASLYSAHLSAWGLLSWTANTKIPETNWRRHATEQWSDCAIHWSYTPTTLQTDGISWINFPNAGEITIRKSAKNAHCRHGYGSSCKKVLTSNCLHSGRPPETRKTLRLKPSEYLHFRCCIATRLAPHRWALRNEKSTTHTNRGCSISEAKRAQGGSWSWALRPCAAKVHTLCNCQQNSVSFWTHSGGY